MKLSYKEPRPTQYEKMLAIKDNDGLVFSKQPEAPYATDMTIRELENLGKFFSKEKFFELAAYDAQTSTTMEPQTPELTQEERLLAEKVLAQLKIEKEIVCAMREEHLLRILSITEVEKESFESETASFNNRIRDLTYEISGFEESIDLKPTRKTYSRAWKSKEDIEQYYDSLHRFISQQLAIKKKEEELSKQQDLNNQQ